VPPRVVEAKRRPLAASLPGQLLYLLGRHGLAAHGDRSHLTRPW